MKTVSLIVLIYFFFFPSITTLKANNSEVISYPELVATKVEKTFTWKNQNGHQESIDITIINIPEPQKIQTLKEEYLSNIYGDSYSEDLLQVNPKMVVLHSMALGNLQKSLRESGFLLDSTSWGISKWGQLPVGSQLLVRMGGQWWLHRGLRAWHVSKVTK